MASAAPDLHALLPEVRAIAREAGAVIMRYYQQGIGSSAKADGSPVTEADLHCDRLICSALAGLTPDLPVVSEESVEAGRIPDVSGGSFWLVDPMDGTKEFLQRTGAFMVNIGLVRHGAPVLGVLYGPARDELYAAAGPGTAVEEVDGIDRSIHVRQAGDDGLVVVSSRQHDNPAQLARILRGVPVKEHRRVGGPFKFAEIARGRADLYPSAHPSGEWDSAAGHAIVTAAGGTVEAFDGGPLTYGKPGFLNREGFVVRGRS
jgi:3'(2'), 5'-bisphosphate nucleotidase